jgi:hypothetical protein
MISRDVSWKVDEISSKELTLRFPPIFLKDDRIIGKNSLFLGDDSLFFDEN